MTRRLSPLYLCLCAQLVMGGCVSQSAQRSPEKTIAAYGWALRHDPERAYAMLSEGLQAEITLERFRALLESAPSEVFELPTHAPEVRAKLSAAQTEFDEVDAVYLALDDGRYEVTDGLLQAVTADTPLKGIQAFRRGLIEALRTARTMGLSPESTAETEAQVRALLEDLQSDADLNIDVRGSDAKVQTPSGRTLFLKRQGGRWGVHSVLHAEER